MKITEQQFREIVGKYIKEALSRDTIKGANAYLNHKGGYTNNQQYNGLGGMLRQRMGAKTDSNGQRDWANSANEIEGYLRQYSNEIKRLQGVYNKLIGKQSAAWSDERKQKAAATRAFNSNYRKANGMNSNNPVWTSQSNGGIDSSKYDAARKNRRNDYNTVAAKGSSPWGAGSIMGNLEESTNEAFLSNLFNRGRNQQNDEVEQICRNWKSYVGNQEAAQKVLDRIEEYKGIVSRLKGIIQQGVSRGHIKNIGAERNAAMRQARKSQGGEYPYKQVAEAVDNAFRKVLNEAIKK